MRKLFHRHSTLSSSQGGEDSSTSSSRIPQQQSTTSRKSFGPSSTQGRCRSRTPDCGPPRGGSPYPQAPPPPPPLPKGPIEPPANQPGGAQPTEQNQQLSSDQPQGQPQGHGQVHLQDQSQGRPQNQEIRLVSRGNGPYVPRGPVEVFGLWCDLCNRRLVELKRQALRLWMPFASSRGATTIKVRNFGCFTNIRNCVFTNIRNCVCWYMCGKQMVYAQHPTDWIVYRTL